jgi:hypothetical protein
MKSEIREERGLVQFREERKRVGLECTSWIKGETFRKGTEGRREDEIVKKGLEEFFSVGKSSGIREEK